MNNESQRRFKTTENKMYEELDSRIIDAIKNYGRCLHTRSVREEAQRISESTGRDTERIIDGRTQALRKRGVIEYVYGKWYVQGGENESDRPA